MSELEARIAEQAAEIEKLKNEIEVGAVKAKALADYTVVCKQRNEDILRAEAAEARVAEMEGQLASCADLANSWARETGITEAVDESGLKDLIDRLWAAWSSRYFGQRENYEEALTEGRAALAESERSRAELQGQLEEARRDTKRLDLIATGEYDLDFSYVDMCGVIVYRKGSGDHEHGETLREAIDGWLDVARSQGEQQSP